MIRAEFPDIAVLVLSAHAVVEHAVDLLTSGERSGYLLKSRVTDVDDFIETLRRIVRGGSVVDPVLVAEITYSGWAADARIRHPVLRGLRLDIDPESVLVDRDA